MHIDPISELLTNIKNAKKAHKPNVVVSYSNLKKNILTVLKNEGYIKDFMILSEGNKQFLDVKLKYKNRTSVIHDLKQISKPGLRIYSEAIKLPKVLNGMGIVLVSTSKGVMTDKQARKENIGGEVIAFVW